jgi:hypothetical protein
MINEDSQVHRNTNTIAFRNPVYINEKKGSNYDWLHNLYQKKRIACVVMGLVRRSLANQQTLGYNGTTVSILSSWFLTCVVCT